MAAIDIPIGAVAGGRPLTADEVRTRAQTLVLRYVITSTLLLLVSGLLGVVIRQSQAKQYQISPALWYELMTAHGLGAFVGWAAFCLMGLSFWIMQENGFALRGWSHTWAVASYWTMVAGVTGIVVTVLAMHFAGSWVFLYPLPFHGVGQWTEWTTAMFAISVISVGLSIFTYCFGMLAMATGSDLGAREGAGVFNRFGCALGLGHIGRFRERFHTDRPLPFAVIPLTVIGIDMIIATIPLAILLVIMVIEAADPSVSVDPLLAKSMLWWFGHPVVYLLLFPAVAAYYHIIPKLAGRELVAGHIIAVAWAIAAITNVIIGAHHMYTDFPEGLQQSIDTFSQPMTYAVTIPSAISLFSLAFTIYRSSFDWSQPAARFLAFALVSWLVAGFQGVMLATIQYDSKAHNTLWVVGHFHNMALIHIGFVIFGAIYYFLPDLIHRPWKSRVLSDWHLGLTLIGGYGMVIAWLWQGMYGAPRRFAQLPGTQYDEASRLSLPFIALVVIGTACFAVNLAATLGVPWLRDVVGPKPAEGDGGGSERGSEIIAAVIAGTGTALSLVALLLSPFLFAPVGVFLAYVGATLGARRAGAWGIVIGLVALVLGLLRLVF
jgi:cytochrome c oxidase subunit 1